VRALTVITPFGRLEPPDFQLDLARSIDELARLRRPAPTRWLRCYDLHGAFTVDWQPAWVTVTDLAHPGGPASGPGVARNRGLATVSDGWITPIDSDDRVVPAGLAALAAAAEGAGVRWAAALADDIDERGEVVYRGPDWVRSRVITRNRFLDIGDERGRHPWHPSAMVIDAALAADCGGWGSWPEFRFFGEDVSFVARLNARHEGLWFPQVVFHRRRHAGMLTVHDKLKPHPDERELIPGTRTRDRSWRRRARRGSAAHPR
jgi:glycosyltransferase involved in cell wall biosynthesis